MNPLDNNNLVLSRNSSFSGNHQLKGKSRIEYFPIEKSTIEYDTVEQQYVDYVPQQTVQYVPVQKSLVQQVPREKKWTEYEAVEYQTQYVPRVEYQTVQEQVPVTKIDYVPQTKIEYVPQQKTDYVTQSRVVEKVAYDEVEYAVQKSPQMSLQNSQVLTTTTYQNPVYVSQIVPQTTYTTYPTYQPGVNNYTFSNQQYI